MRQSGSIGLALIIAAALLGCDTSDSSRPLVPAELRFATQPAATATSQLPLGVVRVEVLTDEGRLVTSEPASVTISLASADTGAHLAGTTTMESVQGTATFTDLSVAHAGNNFRLVAHVAGVDSALSTPFQISSGPASRLSFDPVSPSTVSAGSNVPLVVRTRDAAGNPAAATGTVTIGFSRLSSFGATTAPDGLFGSTTATLVSGVATFPGIDFQKSGNYTLSASAPQLAAATSSALTVSSGPMTQLAFVAPPVNGSANVALPQISVQELDQYGNGFSLPPGPLYTVTLTIGANPTGAALQGTVTRTVFGSTPSMFDDIMIDRPRNGYTLVATSGTMSVTSATFNVQ